MRIGCIEIAPPVVLAPMAGVTNHSFRLICKRFGAGLVCTDMISSYGIHYRNPRTLSMFDWTPEERPVAVQIFGADAHVMAAAAGMVEAAGADIVDINVGCPVPKVKKTGAGAGLIEDLQTARRVMAAVVRAVSIPVTVKTRKGPDERTLTAVEVARIAEDVGVSAICIHGRTAAQGYSGSADWKIIGEAKRAIGIPVIGNGDVRSPADAKRMFDETGCDAVMIGRGALGNPWIFRRTAHFLETAELLPEPSRIERIQTAREHLRLMVQMLGQERAVREMRGQIAWYVKGIPGAAAVRSRAAQAACLAEMEDALAEIRT
ncbi:MAG TPA: tRNA dihydrouridine synthase DusB [Armatimonadota bacterium]|nr:tRNA dihydrouridine synthase DusB [Armatimonadota bacterium]